MSRIEETLYLIQESLRKIEERLSRIEEELHISAQKMGNHIDFVEGVYSSVRRPLDFVKKKIENISGLGREHISLPQVGVPQVGVPQVALSASDFIAIDVNDSHINSQRN